MNQRMTKLAIASLGKMTKSEFVRKLREAGIVDTKIIESMWRDRTSQKAAAYREKRRRR